MDHQIFVSKLDSARCKTKQVEALLKIQLHVRKTDSNPGWTPILRVSGCSRRCEPYGQSAETPWWSLLFRALRGEAGRKQVYRISSRFLPTRAGPQTGRSPDALLTAPPRRL